MTKIVSALLCVCLLLVSVTAAFAAEADLTVDGSWSIRVPASPTAYERFAAEKLRAGLSEALGVSVAAAANVSAPYIAVGSASEADVSDLADNGYRIVAAGGNIHIAGTGTRGLQIGAYRFLEEFCGRKVYTAEITVLPKAQSIHVSAYTDIRYEPYFEYTETDWRSSSSPIAEFSMANGLFGGLYRSLPAEMGGTVRYIGGYCHTMGTLCETKNYKESHPEYLALYNGERTTDQPCLMNPDVLEIATKNVMAILKRDHDPQASLQIVSVTQNDNYHYCRCENCKAFEQAHGGVQSATILYFVNEIADVVKDAGYDNVAIETFAYEYSRHAPTGIVPRDNVIVRLCTIECCFAHPLDDPDCPNNKALMRDLHDWSDICDRLYIWDYTTNYVNTCIVFPDFGVIQRNIQVFYENNVRGIYEEGNYYITSCDTEFGDLRLYMIAKCLQNPYCDLESEINGFLAAYYGDGWTHVRKAIDLYASHAGNSRGHLGIYYSPKNSMHFTDSEVAEIDCCWTDAYDAAGTEQQKAHVARSTISWRFWKACVDQGEFSQLNPERFEETKKLYADMRAHGVAIISEGGRTDLVTGYWSIVCRHEWKEPVWDWSADVCSPTYTAACKYCTVGKATGAVPSEKGDRVDATTDEDAYTPYTATVELSGQTFKDTYKAYEEGTAFDKYKQALKAAADDKKQDGDSDKAAALIDDTKAAIDGVTFDKTQSLDDNKKAVDDAADLAGLERALTDRRAAEEVEDKIAAIGEAAFTDECKDKIDAAREAYDALTDEQSALVDNASDLIAAEEAYELLDNRAQFDEYKETIKQQAKSRKKHSDSDECNQLIDDVIDAIDSVTYDENEQLQQNEDAVDAAANFTQLDADLTAHRAIHYARFYADGTLVESVPYTIDTKSITEPAVPEKIGYTGAWPSYTLKAGGITVDAVYETIPYTAEFFADGVSVGTVTYTVETKSVKDQEPAVTDKPGHTGAWPEYTLGVGGVRIDAVYEVILHTVDFDSNGGKGEMEPVVAAWGGTITLPECAFTAPNGKEFDKWDAGTPGEEIEVKADLTVQAIWKEKPLTLTANVDPTQTGGRIVINVPYARRGATAATLTASEKGVRYKSSRPDVISVDENGVIRFEKFDLSCKTATITVYSASGEKTASCVVNVRREWWQDIIWFVFGILWR